MERLTTSKKVELALKEQGRKKTWLADQLNIGRPTLDKRLKDNFWEVREVIKLKSLGLI
jgi:transcriptional regulator with PAS, ATPase and Fis domain